MRSSKYASVVLAIGSAGLGVYTLLTESHSKNNLVLQLLGLIAALGLLFKFFPELNRSRLLVFSLGLGISIPFFLYGTLRLFLPGYNSWRMVCLCISLIATIVWVLEIES